MAKVQKKTKAEKESIVPIQLSHGLSKQDRMILLLKRPEGSTIDELVSATGWQVHSVRGAMSGVLKKRLGLSITSDVQEHGRVYRIMGGMSRS